MSNVPIAPTPRAYPIPRSVADGDPVLSFGLVVDVCDVVVAHAFPRPQGRDLPALENALDSFIYGGPADYERSNDTPPGGPLPPGIDGWALNGRDGEPGPGGAR